MFYLHLIYLVKLLSYIIFGYTHSILKTIEVASSTTQISIAIALDSTVMVKYTNVLPLNLHRQHILLFSQVLFPINLGSN